MAAEGSLKATADGVVAELAKEGYFSAQGGSTSRLGASSAGGFTNEGDGGFAVLKKVGTWGG